MRPSAFAQAELKIIASRRARGGWDQTARAMQAARPQAAAKSAQVVNVPGAGGTVGLAQFVNSAKGDGSQLLVNGLVMVGAILTNKAPVTLDMVTPIARLTGEYLAVVVPANSPIKDAKQLGAALKADPAKVTFAGDRPAVSTTCSRDCSPRQVGRGRDNQDQLHSVSAAARRWPRSSAVR